MIDTTTEKFVGKRPVITLELEKEYLQFSYGGEIEGDDEVKGKITYEFLTHQAIEKANISSLQLVWCDEEHFYKVCTITIGLPLDDEFKAFFEDYDEAKSFYDKLFAWRFK